MTKQFILTAVLIITLLFTGCSLFSKRANSPTPSPAGLFDAKWQLVELDGKKVAEKVNGRTPFIEFHKKDTSYSASGGCNGMGGQFELKANSKIVFKRGMSTMMYCEDMTVEHGLGRIFTQTVDYTIDSNILLLKTSGHTVAKFLSTPSGD